MSRLTNSLKNISGGILHVYNKYMPYIALSAALISLGINTPKIVKTYRQIINPDFSLVYNIHCNI